MAMKKGSNMHKEATKVLAGADGPAKHAPKGKLKVREMHLRRGHEGGYIARHDAEDEDGSPQHPSPEYPLADDKALLAHVQQHMASPAPGGTAPEVAAEDRE
jgi:hypothetical protein